MRTLLLTAVILTLWTGSPTDGWAQNQASGLVIIVNKTNPTEEISVAELRKIFLAERAHWPQGGSITIAMRSVSPLSLERSAATNSVGNRALR